MKAILAALVIVAGFGLDESVNGDEATVTLVSSDGSYAPGNLNLNK